MNQCDATVDSTAFCFPSLPASKQQLYSVCKNMQTRVVELIPQLVDEGFIEELLVVNDDLNNAFIRYERCVCIVILQYSEFSSFQKAVPGGPLWMLSSCLPEGRGSKSVCLGWVGSPSWFNTDRAVVTF